MQTVTRRGFLGSTAGAIGAAALSETANLTVATAAEQQPTTETRQKPTATPKGLRIGMLTAPFGDKPLLEVLDFARTAGIPCLEVVADPGSKHVDPATLDAAKADEVKQQLVRNLSARH